uniref:Metallothionein-like protein n=1 Tax=Aegilops tauschii TaxID=37682 RepID=R7W5M8_AEGTA
MSCNCGSGCSCGSDCKCGKMYPDLTEQGSAAAQVAAVVVLGVAPENKAGQFEVAAGQSGGAGELGVAAGQSGEGCSCGDNCKCNPCNC